MAGRFNFTRSFTRSCAGFCRSSQKGHGKGYGKFSSHSQQRKGHTRSNASGVFSDRAKFMSSFHPSLHLQAQFPVTCTLLTKIQLSGKRLNSTVAAGVGLSSSAGLDTSESSETLVEPLVDVIQSVPPDILNDSAREILSVVSEPTFQSLGLGGYGPVGMIQNLLEYLHISQGLPWWGAVIGLTVFLRTVLFPLMIKGQVNAARLNAVQPEIEKVQQKIRELANTQNTVEKAAAAMELQRIFRENNCHPLKSLIVPLMQLPVFLSFFVALRQMANLPVESLKDGGAFWVMDLSTYDPYFVLPVIASLTMLAVLEVGAEAGVSNQKQYQTMKVVFRFMCFAMLPLTAKFPAAVFLYWITSNFYSLGQVVVLKIPSFRTYVGLPEKAIKPVVKEKTGGFWENMKAGYKTSQSMARIKNEEKMKRIRYEKSLKNTNQKTFSYNPRAEQNAELFEMAKPKRTKQKSR